MIMAQHDQTKAQKAAIEEWEKQNIPVQPTISLQTTLKSPELPKPKLNSTVV